MGGTAWLGRTAGGGCGKTTSTPPLPAFDNHWSEVAGDGARLLPSSVTNVWWGMVREPGQVVETATGPDVLGRGCHPYTPPTHTQHHPSQSSRVPRGLSLGVSLPSTRGGAGCPWGTPVAEEVA